MDRHSTSIIENQVFISGYTYFGADDTLKVYNVLTKEWKTYPSQSGWQKFVKKVAKGSDGIYWAGGDQGLYQHDPQTDTWSKYTTTDDYEVEYTENFVIDRNNNKWLMAYDGVVKVDPSGTVTMVKTLSNTGQFYSICYDGGDYVYAAGSGTGNGVLKINVLTNQIDNLTTDNFGLNITNITNVFYGNDTLYYSNWDTFGKIHNNQLVRKYEIDPDITVRAGKAPVSDMTSAVVDKRGIIWVADKDQNKLYKLEQGSWSSYDYTNSSCVSVVREVMVDEFNRKWIIGDGIYLLEDHTINNNPTAIVNYLDSKTIVAPNPVTDKANLTLGKDINSLKRISLINLSSNTIESDYSIEGGNVQLNCKNILSGIYFIKIEYKDGFAEMVKFVKL